MDTDFPAYSDTVYSDTPLSVTLLTIPKPFVNKKCHTKRVKTRLEWHFGSLSTEMRLPTWEIWLLGAQSNDWPSAQWVNIPSSLSHLGETLIRWQISWPVSNQNLLFRRPLASFKRFCSENEGSIHATSGDHWALFLSMNEVLTGRSRWIVRPNTELSSASMTLGTFC